jgi:deoxyribodipyrimidine photo-lyase
LDRLEAELDVPVHREVGLTIVEPGAIAPSGGAGHYQVFTPYHRRWSTINARRIEPTPEQLRLPTDLFVGRIPSAASLVDGGRAPDVAPGGATAAHERLEAWIESHLHEYPERHDDLAGDATSRLSPYLHFGCLSPLEVLRAVGHHRGDAADAFVRQLCWRDFFAQVLAARPDAAWSDYVDRGAAWVDDPDGLEAWKAGRTGYPVVDAAMRQLCAEGFVHNRARMVAASFLTKDLGVDWRVGAQHFLDHLVDGDLAQNNLNWQWVAGTGTDTNPHRVFNPTVQGQRFDPDGDYVRRYVPELRAVKGGAVHDPEAKVRRAYDYPDPIVDHREAIAAHRERQSRGRSGP